ncbi:hypothetical protein RhiirB3_524476 [Rhizophagus irregularis]|nr:hypothetical protein RhiirB3_524476 [Rhizophagus irregularis]
MAFELQPGLEIARWVGAALNPTWTLKLQDQPKEKNILLIKRVVSAIKENGIYFKNIYILIRQAVVKRRNAIWRCMKAQQLTVMCKCRV